MTAPVIPGVQVVGPWNADAEKVLTKEALVFLADLHRRFNGRRQQLLEARKVRQAQLDRGEAPTLPDQKSPIRGGSWKVAPIPADCEKRWVEITGPTKRGQVIGALNSGADVFMADFEDALAPSWANLLDGQANMMDAVRKTISYTRPDGRVSKLNEKTATLFVRPRGWHLEEKHLLVDGQFMSGSLFDAGLYIFHNIKTLLGQGVGPRLYLPKMEAHGESKLWADVFTHIEDSMGAPRSTIRVTILIETIFGALEMEEMLYSIKDHILGFNAGRWDYIFSCIKKFRNIRSAIFPDRAAVTMTVPFMRAYTTRLVQVCHSHGAHAIGGMSAFIPSRKDPAVNASAMQKIVEDKEREVGDGFDGTWVAHPDLVQTARDVFAKKLGTAPHQKHVIPSAKVTNEDITNFTIPGTSVSENGARVNISAALQYINHWLQGVGAVGINNLMEDAATAEISRAQLWQWVHFSTPIQTADKAGSYHVAFTAHVYTQMRDEELAKLGGREQQKYGQAADLLDQLVLNSDFVDFLTLPAYDMLVADTAGLKKKAAKL